MSDISYKGVTRSGVGVVGVTEKYTPAELAELLFRRRYRRVVIHRDSEIVGEVGPHRDTGRRTWWGEQS